MLRQTELCLLGRIREESTDLGNRTYDAENKITSATGASSATRFRRKSG
jgi:hypothetical protein